MLVVANQPAPARVVVVGAAWIGKGVGLLGYVVLLLVGGVCKAAGSVAPVLLSAADAVMCAILGEEP